MTQAAILAGIGSVNPVLGTPASGNLINCTGISGKIQPITASISASALTCTLNPTTLDFRSSALNTGTINTRTISTAVSVVIPATATLGTVSGQQSRLVLIAIDRFLAGVVELAVVNISGGTNLDETTLISTTAISAAATADNVVYSTTARTSLPFRVVGYIESTQATAGTWATAPSTIQGQGGQALAAMSSLGYGQTLQSVTRTIATTYYNTTGKPIYVYVNGSTGSGVNSYWLAQVNGVSIMQSNTVPGNNAWLSVGFIVPPSMSYAIVQGSGTTPIAFTYEMR